MNSTVKYLFVVASIEENRVKTPLQKQLAIQSLFED